MGAGQVSEPLYVSIHVPEFPAQAIMRLRPELACSPVVVLAGEPPLQQVCSANDSAFKLGVMQGMTRAELDSFTGLCILRRSEAEEATARIALLEAAGMFTPRIEVWPSAPSAFVAVLDMTGTTRIFGPAAKVIASMSRTLIGLRFSVHFAASANFHTAVCMAALARKAAIIVPPGHEVEYLHQAPLAALSLTPRQAEALALWGLRTLGDLAGLSEVELVVRMGQEGKRLRLLARGEHPHLMVPEEPVFTLQEFRAFDAPIELLDSLLFALGPMLDQLLIRAQNRALALAMVTVKLGLDGGGQHERTIKPSLPVAQREILLKLLHLDLQAYPPSAGVLTLFVHAEPGDRSKAQLGLFAPQLPEAQRLDITLARIAALVGEDRVGRARLLDTHSDDSFKMERFVVPATTAVIKKSKRTTTMLRRCRPPFKLSVKHEGQRIVAFYFRSRQYTVLEAYGPWRKSGDWWSSGVWSREEWDVCASAETDDTLLCVIAYDLLRQLWQLVAFYD